MWLYYWKLIRIAFTHSIHLAHALIFVLLAVAGALAWYLPSTREYLQRLDLEGWQVVVAVAALIFLFRLLSAPYWVFRDQSQEVEELKDTLKKISEERPFTFITIDCTAIGNNFHATPTYNITRINLHFENLDKRLLRFKVMCIAIEYNGKETGVPIPPGETSTFVHGEQQMIYGFDVNGIATSKFPFVLTVSFDIHYDNVPPIGVRGHKRKVRYTIHSFRPVRADNIILEQDEYSVGNTKLDGSQTS